MSPLIVLSVLFMFMPQRGPSAESPGVLQLGTSLSRTIGQGQVQRYGIPLKQEEFAQIIVDPHGVDVMVSTVDPDGQIIEEFDSPNVSVTAVTTGTYSINISPVTQNQDTANGRYEIRLVEIRHATPRELQAGRRRDILKQRGIAVLNSVIETLGEIRSIQTRVHAQMQAAELLRSIDDSLGRRLTTDAMAAVREFIQRMPEMEPDNYYSLYAIATSLRQEVLQFLASFDPAAALSFIRSTPIPEGFSQRSPGQQDPEVALEINVATQIASNDPARAVQIAEAALDRGYASGMANVISMAGGASAAQLSKEVAGKLQDENLLSSVDAANLATNLLRLAHSPVPLPAESGGNTGRSNTPLLSDQDYRALFTKTLSTALAFSPAPGSGYTPELGIAQSILSSLKSMNAEMQIIAPSSLPTVEEKLSQLTALSNPRGRYYEAVNKSPVDSALATIQGAPSDMRESLYQQLAQKVAREGDPGRARQILIENLPNSIQRRTALDNLEHPAIYDGVNHGNFDDALRAIAAVRSPRERANLINSVVNQLEGRQKRGAALSFLEQSRLLLAPSPQASGQDDMNSLLQIARAFARLGSTRGFDIAEPLIDQFNDLSDAALTLNGFGQQYYEDGELQVNGNPIGNIATQLTQTLGNLGVIDLDRAQHDIERIRRPEVRVTGLIAIAQQAMNPPPLRRAAAH